MATTKNNSYPAAFNNPGFLSDSVNDLSQCPTQLELDQRPRQKEETNSNTTPNNEDRGTWDKPIEFLLSCISMSVGLGNVWRFPYVAARNGGGAFLIPYLVVLIFIGRPLYYLEMCLGQFSRFGQVKCWNLAPILKGIGYAAFVSGIATCSYYVMLMAITVHYFFSSFSTELPWALCDQDKLPDGLYCNETGAQANYSDWYFQYSVFPQVDSLDGGVGRLNLELVLCLVFAWIIIYLSLIKGIKSSGKVAYFTALFPYLVLFILLIKGVTLKGSLRGIKVFLEPQWDLLGNPKVWYAACEQCFFSLTIGFGLVINFSSFNAFNQNIYRDAVIISFMDTFTSLLAGITIFSVIGNLMEEHGLTQISGGPGLAFVLYPKAIASFGWAPQVFAVLFFLMLFTLGIGSATALTASVVTTICDQFSSLKRWMVTIAVCVCGCLAGLIYLTEGGMLILDLVDHYGAGFILYIIAIFESAGICYVYGLNNFCNDVEFMVGRRPGIYWMVCWGVILPLGLLGNLFYYLITEPTFTSGGVKYPIGATIAGWMLTGFAVGLVPAWAIHAVVSRKAVGIKWKFLEALKPTKRWGPQDPAVRQEWEEFCRIKKKRNGLCLF